MSRVQKFPYLLIYLFLCLFKNLLLYHSLYHVVVRFPTFLQVSAIPGCQLSSFLSVQHFLAFSYFTCACFSELFVMEGFLSAFSLLNNLCWKSFNISIKKTFSFAQRTLLKTLPKVKPRLHELLYNVVLGRKNDILCSGNTKIYD